MQNIACWKPTKIVRRGDSFEPSSDPRYMLVASRLVSSCQVRSYEQAIRRFASGRLLDLGCGFVPYYEMYRDLVADNTCVEWEDTTNQSEFLDHRMNLNEPLSLESESYDTVLLTDVLEHIYQPAKLIAEVARLLRPGGHVIIGVPFFYWLHEKPHDFYRYTEFALRQLCEDAELEVKILEPYGGVPEILIDIVGKCLSRAKLDTLCRVYTSTALLVRGLRLFRAVSEKTARAFPLGYVLVASRNLDAHI
jgi:SAM-dependent methyltransferase